MALNIYDTIALVALVPNLKTSQNWLLDRFFPNIVESDSERVAIDIDVGKRRMSPFVSPLVEGRLVEQRRYQTNEFKPAYIKDRRAPDLRKPVRRQIGERIGGELTGAERELVNIQFEMADQIDMLNRRLEWMAAQVMQSGTVTITGDGFPTVTIDFGRASGLTITLSGGTRWGQAGVSPAANIETWATTMLKADGVTATDIVFTPSSWNYFKADAAVAGAINYPVWNPSGNMLDPGTRVVKGAAYKGRWGQFDLWLYNDWYVDANEVEQPMLTDGQVLMSGGGGDGYGMNGLRAFGQILDPAFNYGPMAYAPKSWVREDPAQRFLLMQSSPLVIPSRVNGCLSAQVI